MLQSQIIAQPMAPRKDTQEHRQAKTKMQTRISARLHSIPTDSAAAAA